VKLKLGGVEVDVLTRPEAREMIAQLRDPRPLTTRPEESGRTDGAGGLVLPIYTVPAGMEWRCHLLNVEADGFTPALPFNGAGGYWQLRVAERVVDEGSLVAAAANGFQIPFTRGYGFMQGAVAYNLEVIDLKIVAGPVNTLIRALTQGSLLPKPSDAPPEL
jgi:hypothetical protein